MEGEGFFMKNSKHKGKTKILKLSNAMPWFAAVFLLTFSLFHLSGTMNELNKQEEQFGIYQQEIEELKEEIKNTEYLLKEENRQVLIEQAARDKLNFAYPNDKVFLEIN